MSDISYLLAKNFGEMQYNLIILELIDVPDDKRHEKMQYYWNQFKAIMNVSMEYAELMQSKYLPLLFAYQTLFNFKAGCIPNIDGINTNEDTSEIELEIINYLKEKSKGCKKCH